LKNNGVEESKVKAVGKGIITHVKNRFGKKWSDFEPYAGESSENDPDHHMYASLYTTKDGPQI